MALVMDGCERDWITILLRHRGTISYFLNWWRKDSPAFCIYHTFLYTAGPINEYYSNPWGRPNKSGLALVELFSMGSGCEIWRTSRTCLFKASSTSHSLYTRTRDTRGRKRWRRCAVGLLIDTFGCEMILPENWDGLIPCWKSTDAAQFRRWCGRYRLFKRHLLNAKPIQVLILIDIIKT